MKTTTPKTIDEYIENFPEDVQEKLRKIRATIKKAAPDAKEVISYQIPAFKQGEILIYFAAFSKHISIFPTSSGVAKFENELEEYEISKGTIKIPIEKPIPYRLISRITQFRVKEVITKGKE